MHLKRMKLKDEAKTLPAVFEKTYTPWAVVWRLEAKGRYARKLRGLGPPCSKDFGLPPPGLACSQAPPGGREGCLCEGPWRPKIKWIFRRN